MNNEGLSTNRRNDGIDALRLLSMLLVVILHLLTFGGVVNAARGPQNAIARLIEIIATCAVNCFAMISGYVGYSPVEKRWRPSKYLCLWLGVLFYNLGINLVANLVHPGLVSSRTVLKSMLPVITKEYWYFSAYTGLFFIMPGLNALLRGGSDRELNLTVGVGFLVFSALGVPASIYKDIFSLRSGYSLVWLIILYVAGGWMKRNEGFLTRWVTPPRAAALCAACVLVTWAFLPRPGVLNVLLRFTSPTILLFSFGLVQLFSRLSIRGAAQAFVRCFSPAAFGVYLIHDHPVIWKTMIYKHFTWIADSPAWLLPLQVIGCAAAIFFPCLLIEKLRLLAFRGIARAFSAAMAALKRNGAPE